MTDSDGNDVRIPLASIDDNTTNISLTEDGTDLILTDSDGNDVRIPLANIDDNTTNISLTSTATIRPTSDGRRYGPYPYG